MLQADFNPRSPSRKTLKDGFLPLYGHEMRRFFLPSECLKESLPRPWIVVNATVYPDLRIHYVQRERREKGDP